MPRREHKSKRTEMSIAYVRADLLRLLDDPLVLKRVSDKMFCVCAGPLCTKGSDYSAEMEQVKIGSRCESDDDKGGVLQYFPLVIV